VPCESSSLPAASYQLPAGSWKLKAGSYPCLCLCFWFGQITRTTPRRRTILHLSHIRLTDALTFISFLYSYQLSAISYQPSALSCNH
jgi:hypothetical protein